jgi:hypothetical protein
MDFKANYEKTQTKDEAFTKVSEHITPELLQRYKVNPTLDYNKDKYEISAKGTGFELIISFLDDAAQVKLNLSLILRPLKGKILESVEKQIKRVI